MVPIECIHPETAQARAEQLVAALDLPWGDGFWAGGGGAEQVLRCYLMAAAICGVGLDEVRRWAADPGDREPFDALRSRPGQVPQSWIFGLDAVLRQAPANVGATMATVRAALREAPSGPVA